MRRTAKIIIKVLLSVMAVALFCAAVYAIWDGNPLLFWGAFGMANLPHLLIFGVIFWRSSYHLLTARPRVFYTVVDALSIVGVVLSAGALIGAVLSPASIAEILKLAVWLPYGLFLLRIICFVGYKIADKRAASDPDSGETTAQKPSKIVSAYEVLLESVSLKELFKKKPTKKTVINVFFSVMYFVLFYAAVNLLPVIEKNLAHEATGEMIGYGLWWIAAIFSLIHMSGCYIIVWRGAYHALTSRPRVFYTTVDVLTMIVAVSSAVIIYFGLISDVVFQAFVIKLPYLMLPVRFICLAGYLIAGTLEKQPVATAPSDDDCGQTLEEGTDISDET